MRGERRHVSRQALLVGSFLVAGVIGCDAVATGPSGSLPPHPAAVADPPALADVTTYRGDDARTGRMPGPGPDGKPVELWQVQSGTGYAAQPLVHGGLVIAVSVDGEVIALDGGTGERRWSTRLPAGVTSNPAISDDTLFVVTHDGELRALSLTDRKERWHETGHDPEASPAVAGDLVLAGAANGELVAYRATDGSQAWSAPTAAAGRVAIAGDRAAASGSGSDRVMVVNVRDGTTVFEQSTGGAEALTPALVDGKIYVAHRAVAGGANGVDAFGGDGEPLWSFDEPDRLRLEGILVGEDVVFVLTDVPARVHALDRATGRLRWSQDVDEESIGGGVVADGLVYVIGTEHGLSAIDASNGRVPWNVPLGVTMEPIRMVVTGGLAIVAATAASAGRIIAFAGASDPRHAEASAPDPSRALEPSASATTSPRPSPGFRIVKEHHVEADAVLLGAGMGPDETLYVPDVANDRILVLAPDGAQRWWGASGTGSGEFDFSQVTQNDASAGVAVAPDGELIAVGEGGNHRVQLFDRHGTHLRSIGRLGRGDGQFVNPTSVTIDAAHRIWVVDAARADVQVFDEGGRFLRRFAGEGGGDGQLRRPGAAFVREDADEVLVADFGNRRVAVFAKDGSWLRAYESRPEEELYLWEVNVVVVGPDGRLLILDTSNRISILDPSGSVLGIQSLSATGYGPIDTAGLAVSPSGRLYAVDLPNDRIIEAQLEPPLWPVAAAQP